MQDLSEEELTRLREEVDNYTVEGDLRRFNALNIKRLKEIGCYRGRRHYNVRVAPLLPLLLVGGDAIVLCCSCSVEHVLGAVQEQQQLQPVYRSLASWRATDECCLPHFPSIPPAMQADRVLPPGLIVCLQNLPVRGQRTKNNARTRKGAFSWPQIWLLAACRQGILCCH